MENENLSPAKEKSNIENLAMMLTYKCQMACRYCFLDRRHPDMSEDVLYRSIDLLFTSPSQEIELQFFGGEPLLRFDLIKKAIAYAENKTHQMQKRIKYLINTNGLLLDERKLEYLKGFNVYFLLSIDGSSATQLFNRPLIKKDNYYPFKKLIRNPRLLLRKDFDFFVNIVIGPDNIDLFSRNISFLFRHSVKKIRFSYELGVFWEDAKINEYFTNIFKIMHELTQESPVEIINIGADDEPYLSSPALTVDYDGKIYCGCTIPLEKLFVNLRKVNLVGDVRVNKTMQEIKKTKMEAIRSLSDFYLRDSNTKKIILNNLTLGKMSDHFFNSLFKKEKSQKLLKIDIPRTVNSLMLMCTYACQFNCDYCQVKRLPLSMPLKVLRQAVELLLTSRSSEIQLRFWGGEPLLEWRLIKEGIRFAEKKAKEKGKIIKFMITTNGLALDEKKLDYLKNHRVEIMFSLDGSLETDSAHRFIKNKNQTFKRTLMNLGALIRSQLPYFVNAVVSPDTVSRLSHNLNFFKELGVKRLQLDCYNGTLWSQEETKTLINELKKFIQKGNNYEFLMNFTNDSQPIILSQEILVDTNGLVYFDAAIFMEEVFPNLRKAYFLGRVSELKDIDSLYRTRNQLYSIFKESCLPQERKIFLNNIDLGLRLEAALNSFQQQSLDSNEHPLFIPIIKGDFSVQRQVLERLKIIDSLFLYLDGPCLNDCCFCKHKEEKFSDLFKIEAKLKGNLKIRGTKLCVIGNEPLMHPQIQDIIRLAKTFGFRQIQIMTSGEYLCDTEFCRQLIKIGVTSFSLPLFAVQEAIHDLITGRAGSFQQVMQAIKNILGNGAKVFVHANLIKHNIDYLKSLERFVKQELKVPFVIVPIRAKTANLSFKELMPSYTEIICKLKGINSLIGFPLCVTGRIQEDLFKSTDDISDSMKLYLLDQRFFKPKVCDKCLYFKRCLGVFKEYGYLYGTSQIKPF